jgi:putative redox protein
MRDVDVRSGSESGLAVAADVGGHHLVLDEPLETGGTDTGASPTETLLVALGACEAITLKMYAARKGWALRDVRVRLNGSMVDGVFVIRRRLEIDGVLDADQRERLHQIAGRCPVHRILMGEVRVEDVTSVDVDGPR